VYFYTFLSRISSRWRRCGVTVDSITVRTHGGELHLRSPLLEGSPLGVLSNGIFYIHIVLYLTWVRALMAWKEDMVVENVQEEISY